MGAKLDGPFGVCAWLRQRVQTAAQAPGWMHSGVACPFCWSFYTTGLSAWLTSTGSVGFASASSATVEFVVVWLAGFGLACFLFLYTGH
jgi:hypothetical protein